VTNQDLDDYEPTGASAATARQDGLDFSGRRASERMADTDAARVLRYRLRFEAAAIRLELPPALLAGVASRESRGGRALDARGFGDHGNAFGILQIDRRFHELRGTSDPASQAHIDQAALILRGFWTRVTAMHAGWPAIRQLQGAVAAYNSGVGNVRTLDGMDVGTTGNDYSNDVWARALFYATRWSTAD
jgi:soluble lytic murein transglycosylase-like protein